MERLTKKVSYGYEVAKMDALYTGRNAVVDRLGAYEETGLSPEEVRAMQHTMEEYHKEADPLLRAKAEGRLVELPCKEADDVYVLLMGRALPFEVTSVNLDGRGVPLFRAMHGLRLIYAFRPEDIGKAVFLTREEAEAALRKEDDHA